MNLMVVEEVLGLGSAERGEFAGKGVGECCDLRKGHDLVRTCVHQPCTPQDPMFLRSLWLEVAAPVDTSLEAGEIRRQ